MSREHEQIGQFHSGFELFKLAPKEPISPIPVLIEPGFAANAESHLYFMKELSGSGFTAICPTYRFDLPGEPKRWGLVSDMHRLKLKSIPAIIEAEGYSKEEEMPKQVDVVAHSKGAVDIAIVASIYPEKFRNIIMVAPGGLRPAMLPWKKITSLMEGQHKDREDKDRLIQGGNNILQEMDRANMMYGARFKKSKSRYILEAFDSVRNIRKLLPKLADKGIEVAILCQKEDPMYPPKLFDEFVRNSVWRFIEVEGIHGEFKFNPNVGQVVINLLKEMRGIPNST